MKRARRSGRLGLLLGVLLFAIACGSTCEQCELACKVSKLEKYQDKLLELLKQNPVIGLKAFAIGLLKKSIEEEQKANAPNADLQKKEKRLTDQVDRLVSEVKTILEKNLPELPADLREDFLKQARDLLINTPYSTLEELLKDLLKKAQEDKKTLGALKPLRKKLATLPPDSPEAAEVSSEIAKRVEELLAVRYHDAALHLVRVTGFLEKCSGIIVPREQLEAAIRQDFPNYPKLLSDSPR